MIQTENNYDKEVFNGDIGQVVSIDPEERESCLLAQEFKRIGGCRLCMNGFPKRWIIILRAVYPWRNFAHSHLVGRVGDQ